MRWNSSWELKFQTCNAVFNYPRKTVLENGYERKDYRSYGVLQIKCEDSNLGWRSKLCGRLIVI